MLCVWRENLAGARMVAITIYGQGGVEGIIDVQHDHPIGPALRAFAQQHLQLGALFINEQAAPGPALFSPAHNACLRVLLYGERVGGDCYTTSTPDDLELQDGDGLDILLGQGGPTAYPNSAEVFNTQAGALAYYQVEVRRLRGLAHPAAMQQQQLNGLQAQVAQLQQEKAQLAQEKAQLQQEKATVASEASLLRQERTTASSETSRLHQRVATLERLRQSGLEELRGLRREKKAEEQKKAREVQLAKLRSLPSRSSACGLGPVAPTPHLRPLTIMT